MMMKRKLCKALIHSLRMGKGSNLLCTSNRSGTNEVGMLGNTGECLLKRSLGEL